MSRYRVIVLVISGCYSRVSQGSPDLVKSLVCSIECEYGLSFSGEWPERINLPYHCCCALVLLILVVTGVRAFCC